MFRFNKWFGTNEKKPKDEKVYSVDLPEGLYDEAKKFIADVAKERNGKNAIISVNAIKRTRSEMPDVVQFFFETRFHKGNVTMQGGVIKAEGAEEGILSIDYDLKLKKVTGHEYRPNGASKMQHPVKFD